MLAYEDLGAWKIRILDAANHPHPQVETGPSALPMALMG